MSHLDAPESAPENTSFDVVQAKRSSLKRALSDELAAEEASSKGPSRKRRPLMTSSSTSEPTLDANGDLLLPAYGAGCRFVTEDVIQMPSNDLSMTTCLSMPSQKRRALRSASRHRMA